MSTGTNARIGDGHTSDRGLSKTVTDNIGAVVKADTAEYVAALKTTTDTIGAVAKADTKDDVTASKNNDGYEVYAINCFKKTVGAIFFLEEDIDMEVMDNNTGEIFVKEGDCKYVGHTQLERPKFDVNGQDVDVQGLAWPDAWHCKDMGNT